MRYGQLKKRYRRKFGCVVTFHERKPPMRNETWKLASKIKAASYMKDGLAFGKEIIRTKGNFYTMFPCGGSEELKTWLVQGNRI